VKKADTSRRVLITGGSGFTGQHLVAALEQKGHQAHVPASLDLTDSTSVAQALHSVQPDAVVHLGAISFAAHGDSMPYYETNTLGTLNLLAAIAEQKIELSHFIFASTAAVYGNQGRPVLGEGLTPQPDGDYGISKLAAEHLVRVHSNARSTVVFRPFNYTGVGQSEQFIIPKLVKHYALREPEIELGNIDVAREFNDVRWAVSAYVAALDYEGAQVTLNLCTGNAHKLRDVMMTLESITGHQPKLKTNQAFVRANDLPSLAGDPERLNAEFVLAQPSSLNDTLSWMCDYYASSR